MWDPHVRSTYVVSQTPSPPLLICRRGGLSTIGSPVAPVAQGSERHRLLHPRRPTHTCRRSCAPMHGHRRAAPPTIVVVHLRRGRSRTKRRCRCQGRRRRMMSARQRGRWWWAAKASRGGAGGSRDRGFVVGRRGGGISGDDVKDDVGDGSTTGKVVAQKLSMCSRVDLCGLVAPLPPWLGRGVRCR